MKRRIIIEFEDEIEHIPFCNSDIASIREAIEEVFDSYQIIDINLKYESLIDDKWVNQPTHQN